MRYNKKSRIRIFVGITSADTEHIFNIDKQVAGKDAIFVLLIASTSSNLSKMLNCT